MIASLRQQENREEKQVRNVLKFSHLRCRHDTSALKPFFSCKLVKTNPDLNGTKGNRRQPKDEKVLFIWIES